MAGRPPVPVVERLLEKVLKTESGCWVWTGSVRKDYGQIRARKIDGTWSVRQAHVVAYEELVGPVPEGLELDHLCRNTLCINPDHLEPVTHKVNIERGLVARGVVAFAPTRPASSSCDHCASTFEMNRLGRRRRFCSDDCRTTYWNLRRAA